MGVGFVPTLHLSFGPCIDVCVLFITFFWKHMWLRDIYGYGIGMFAISYTRRKFPDCPVTPWPDDSKRGAGHILGSLCTQCSRKGEGMRAETFLHLLPPTCTHLLCKDEGICIKANAGLQQQAAISLFCSQMLPGQHSHDMLQEVRCSAVCHQTGTGLANIVYAPSRQSCRCSGPPRPAKQVSGKHRGG